jgi:response regulator RpfG family c-di-GMP phosphodiesterase
MEPGSSTRTKRVLMVDDEPDNLEIFQRACRNRYEVMTATSAEQGLKLLAASEFDVVLTDYKMPELSGAEFVRRAKAIQRVAMVMVSGYTDQPEINELKESGAVFMLVEKPWRFAQLVSVIEKASEHTRALRG